MNMESILKCTANFRDYLLKDLAKPEFAKHYLEISVENYQKDGEIEILLQAIRDVVEAQGGIEKLAASTMAIFSIYLMPLIQKTPHDWMTY